MSCSVAKKTNSLKQPAKISLSHSAIMLIQFQQQQKSETTFKPHKSQAGLKIPTLQESFIRHFDRKQTKNQDGNVDYSMNKPAEVVLSFTLHLIIIKMKQPFYSIFRTQNITRIRSLVIPRVFISDIWNNFFPSSLFQTWKPDQRMGPVLSCKA